VGRLCQSWKEKHKINVLVKEMAVEATPIEPVSVRFSLINGNLQGKNVILDKFIDF